MVDQIEWTEVNVPEPGTQPKLSFKAPVKENVVEVDVSETDLTDNVDDVEETSLDEATSDVKLEIDEDDINEEVETSEDISNKAKESKPDKAIDSDKSDSNKSDRKNRRIRELVERSKAAAALAENERLEKERLIKEKEDLLRLLQSTAKTSKETQKESINKQLDAFKIAYSQALQDGDATAAVDISEKMMDLKIQLMRTSDELQKIDTVKTADSQKPNQPVQVSPKAYRWVEEHPAFKTDNMFNAAALSLDAQLTKEGYDPSTDSYYEELNDRLSVRFPEYFDVNTPNSVELNESDDSSDGSDVNSSTKRKAVTPQRHVQTVAGSSRSPNTNPQKQSNKQEVIKFTQKDVEVAKRFGHDLKRMAKRISHINNNRTREGFVTIDMD